MKNLEIERYKMVSEQIDARGVKDRVVLDALKKVPRHLFVPLENRHLAYRDQAISSYHHQTISQPYMVAVMTELLSPKKNHRVLEIGTGSGYQTAVLAELVKEVYSIELLPELHNFAKSNLENLGYKNIHCICGDGYKGFPEQPPFDSIIVTAAPPDIPEKLVEQLSINGKMVIPIGDKIQELYLLTKVEDGQITKKNIFQVIFVPMIKEETL